jgi:hypothetical protein
LVVKPLDWVKPGAQKGATKAYHFCSLGWALGESSKSELMDVLAEAARYGKGSDADSSPLHRLSQKDLLTANIDIIEVDVSSIFT